MSRKLAKAIAELSGDQAGSWSACGLSVSWMPPEPSAFMFQTAMVARPVAAASKAILEPSGDQAGKKLDVGRPAVRFLRPVPSALITQMFFLPVVLPRELSNAIL